MLRNTETVRPSNPNPTYKFFSVRLGAMPKEVYDVILADGATSAATDSEYAGCLISRVSKIPPFYFPQTPNEMAIGGK